jgi:TonB family protein
VLDAHPYRQPSAAEARLLAFVGLSLALHAATFAGYTPDGLSGKPRRGSQQDYVLHATLSPVQPRENESSVAAQANGPVDAAAHSSLALGEKWFTAAELDVRAEPLTAVDVEYPEALEGSGITGRVRLVLFIDEKGLVRKAQIASSNPERVFDDAAIKGWQSVRFAPAQKNGAAVKSQKLLELDFAPQR